MSHGHRACDKSACTGRHCERQVDAADHVTILLSSCSRMLYAMHVVRARGTPATSLHDICHATVVSRIEYAERRRGLSVMCSAADNDSLLRRSVSVTVAMIYPPLTTCSAPRMTTLSCRVISNSNHVLHPYLPDETNIPYQLRTRSHRMTLINKTKFLNDADFIIRLLYKHPY